MQLMCASSMGRLEAALHHAKHDRVPNLEVSFDARAVSHLLGRRSEIGWWQLPPEEAVAVALVARQDAVFCSLTWSPPLGSVRTMQDARALVPPDPAEGRAKMRAYLAAAAGTGLGVCARLTCPFTAAYTSTGPIPIQSFMYMLYDRPELVDYVMELYLSVALAQVEAIADLPFRLVYLGDDIAGNDGLLVSPATMGEIWLERTRTLVEALLDTGRPMIFHCCGKQEFLYPFLVKWGVHAVHPVQPGPNDIYAVHRTWGDKLTLVGNIDVNGVLSFGDPRAVAEDTREHIERLAGDGGYVVCSSHSIIDSVDPENYLAMVNATEAYGRY